MTRADSPRTTNAKPIDWVEKTDPATTARHFSSRYTAVTSYTRVMRTRRLARTCDLCHEAKIENITHRQSSADARFLQMASVCTHSFAWKKPAFDVCVRLLACMSWCVRACATENSVWRGITPNMLLLATPFVLCFLPVKYLICLIVVPQFVKSSIHY